MNNERYDAITTLYRSRQKKRLLLSAGLMVLGYALAVTVVGGIVGLVSMIYLMLEGIRTLGLRNQKKASLKKLEQKGDLSEGLESLESSAQMQVDGVTYAISDKYLCLPHGALLPLSDIAWVYQVEQTIRLFVIPVMKVRWCKIALLDGTQTLAFYGKVRDQQAFANLMSVLKDRIPSLLAGYSAENQKSYQALVAAHKDNPTAYAHKH